MKTFHILLYILVMAGVTYLVRMLPLVLFKQKLESPFIRSFLFYIPYAVLGAMTFPAILSSTSSPWSAAAGLAVAIILALLEKGLLPVALASCLAAYLTEWALRL